jgi:hypothetical protein
MLQETVGAGGDVIQHRAYNVKIFAPSNRDDEALPLALEQLDAELGFQRLDPLADGTLRDREFLCGASKAFVPRRDLECFERAQGWQLTPHGGPTPLAFLGQGRETAAIATAIGGHSWWN